MKVLKLVTYREIVVVGDCTRTVLVNEKKDELSFGFQIHGGEMALIKVGQRMD